MEPFKVVDYESAEKNLESLKVRGKIKPAEYRRLKKGIANVQQGQDQGFAYDMNTKTNTFTAKNEAGEDARGKFGGTKGLNIIEGRKTSKAMGYLSKFASNGKSFDEQKESILPPSAESTKRVKLDLPIALPKRGVPEMPDVNLKVSKPTIPSILPTKAEENPVPGIKDSPKSYPKLDLKAKGGMPSVYKPDAPVVEQKTIPEKPDNSAQIKANATIQIVELQKKAQEALAKGDLLMVSTYERRMKALMQNAGMGDNTTHMNIPNDQKAQQLEVQKKQAKDRGDFATVSKINAELAKLNASPAKQKGGKVPMGENGFSIQPFQPRKLNNSFLEQKPVTPGKFTVNQEIKNRFLVGETPAFQTPVSSYLKKPVTQSWSSFNPSTTTPETSFKPQGVPAYEKPAFSVQHEEPLVMPDGAPPSQDRASRPFDKFSAINTGLGLTGAASLLTNKAPKFNPTPEFKDVIRPFSGNQQGLDQKNGLINESAYSAANDLKNTAGSNTTAYLTGRAMVQANTNQAKAAAVNEDTELMLRNRDKFDAQVSRQGEINFNNRVNDQKEAEARAYQGYLGRAQTSQAMVQQALNYSNAKQADEKNKAIQLKQVEERMKSVKDASKYNILYGAIARGGLESLTPELRAAYDELMGIVPAGKNGMKISYFKKGGKIDYTPDKILAEANGNLKKVMLSYSAFVANASRGQMQDFQRYIREINKVNRVNIKRS